MENLNGKIFGLDFGTQLNIQFNKVEMTDDKKAQANVSEFHSAMIHVIAAALKPANSGDWFDLNDAVGWFVGERQRVLCMLYQTKAGALMYLEDEVGSNVTNFYSVSICGWGVVNK